MTFKTWSKEELFGDIFEPYDDKVTKLFSMTRWSVADAIKFSFNLEEILSDVLDRFLALLFFALLLLIACCAA